MGIGARWHLVKPRFGKLFPHRKPFDAIGTHCGGAADHTPGRRIATADRRSPRAADVVTNDPPLEATPVPKEHPMRIRWLKEAKRRQVLAALLLTVLRQGAHVPKISTV